MGLHRHSARLVALSPLARVRLIIPAPVVAALAALAALVQATAAQAAAAPPTSGSPDDDVEGEPRLSLPTEADQDAWRRSGFRFGLGLSYGQLSGQDGAPSGRLRGFLMRLGLRLDQDWSVLASFQYALASAPGGLSGLRFAGTIDPTWHLTSHLAFAVGLGFGGIVEGNTARPDIDPLPSTLETTYTFPGANPPLPSCSGVGAAGLARLQWSFVLGPRSATGLIIEALGQWTGCVADTGTGRARHRAVDRAAPVVAAPRSVGRVGDHVALIRAAAFAAIGLAGDPGARPGARAIRRRRRGARRVSGIDA